MGFASFAFFVLLGFFGRHKPDERELWLFYKTGNTTMGLMILCLVGLHFLQDQTISGFRIGDNWMMLSVCSFIVIQGLVGLYYFRSPEKD